MPARWMVAEKKFGIELVSSGEEVIGRGEILVSGNSWEKYQCIIKSDATDAKGKVRVILKTAGEVDLDHISMFPTGNVEKS